MNHHHKTDRDYAKRRDLLDPIRHIRDRFYINPGIYMDGNSLGLLSKDAEASLARVVDEWKQLGINGWMHAQTPWFTYAEKLAAQFAPLIGAQPKEIILHASTTVNLHALLATFYLPQGEKRKILIEQHAFPTDRYAVQSQLQSKGFDAQQNLIKTDTLDEHNVIDAMTDDVALVLLPSVL